MTQIEKDASLERRWTTLHTREAVPFKSQWSYLKIKNWFIFYLSNFPMLSRRFKIGPSILRDLEPPVCIGDEIHVYWLKNRWLKYLYLLNIFIWYKFNFKKHKNHTSYNLNWNTIFTILCLTNSRFEKWQLCCYNCFHCNSCICGFLDLQKQWFHFVCSEEFPDILAQRGIPCQFKVGDKVQVIYWSVCRKNMGDEILEWPRYHRNKLSFEIVNEI